MGSEPWDAESALHRTEEEWKSLIEADAKRSDADIAAAASLVLTVLARCNEVMIGGDDSPFLVQLLGAGVQEGERDLDFMCSVLLPTSEVSIAYTARRSLEPVLSFWRWRPQAPVLVDCGEERYDYVLAAPAELPAEERLPLSAQTVRYWRQRQVDTSIGIFLPRDISEAQARQAGSPCTEIEVEHVRSRQQIVRALPSA